MTDKRQEIEAAAAKAIRRDGLKSISFRTLADEVGVKSSSVHYHFPTKSDLAHSVVQAYSDRFVARLADLDRQQPTLLGKLDGLVDAFEEVLAGEDFCLCGMMAAEVTALDDETRRALTRFFGTAEVWLTQVFAGHGAELSTELAPEQLAKVFMSGLEGALLVDRVDQDGDRLSAYRALARALIR